MPIGSKEDSVKTTRQVINLISGNDGNVASSIKEEVRLKLIDKGLTIDSILDKYKEVVDKPDVKFKGSDVLTVLERLENLHGLNTKSSKEEGSHDNISLMLQSKTIDEIKTFVMTISGKAEEYLKRLETKDNK